MDRTDSRDAIASAKNILYHLNLCLKATCGLSDFEMSMPCIFHIYLYMKGGM